MKFITYFVLATGFLLMVSACNNPSGNAVTNGADSLNPDEKPSYYENGKLHYIVEYHDGKANGRVREYYPDGKLYMQGTFKNDHRHGKITHYFKNGKPFSEAWFVDGKKDSIELKYNQFGRLIAKIPFKDDEMQPGLEEYNADGSLVTYNEKIVINEIDLTATQRKFIFKVSLSPSVNDVKYYASTNDEPDKRMKLKISDGAGVLEIPAAGGFQLKKILFEAEYKTKMGNKRIISRSYSKRH